MSRTGLLFPVICMLAAFCGCEAARFAKARQIGTIDVYRAFLVDYPTGKHTATVRLQLENAVFAQARRADRPIGYRLYLQQYPRGRFAQRARHRLAKLGLEAARDAADLIRVLERYPNAPSSAEASKRLAQRLAEEALASEASMFAERYLRRFAGHERAKGVREHLATLEYSKLERANRTSLEDFAVRFAATKAAARANARIADLLAAEIQLTQDPLLLEKFRLHFPKDPRRSRLSRLVFQLQATDALARVDLPMVTRLSSDPQASPALVEFARRCKRRPARCEGLRALAKKAAPWHPEMSLDQLERSVLDLDPLKAWKAIAILGNHPDPRAGHLLVEQLGSKRIDVVWITRRTLVRWINGWPGPPRKRWISSRLSTVPHRSNLDEVQRHSWLQMCYGASASKRRDGSSALRRLVHSNRSMTAAFLLIGGCGVAPGLQGDPRLVARLMSAIQARIQWLRSAFPALEPHSVTPARMNERELFVLGLITERLRANSAKQAALADIKRRVSTLLANWRGGLKQVDASFEPATDVEPAFLAIIDAHEQKRIGALEQLLRRRDLLARTVASAVCDRCTRRASRSVLDKLVQKCRRHRDKSSQSNQR